MADRYSNKNRQAVNYSVFMQIFIAVFLILLTAAIGAGIFFKVTEIEVVGATEYTSKEIIDISGIELGDSLFLINASRAGAAITGKLNLVKDAQIIPTIPNKVTIVITENTPVAYVKLDSVYWTVDSTGKLLRQSNMPPANLIQLKGITPISPAEGEKLALGEAGATTLAYLVDMLSAVEKLNIQGDISEMDFSNVSNITFKYLGRFTVNFGRGDNSADKMTLIVKSAGDLGEAETGTISIVSDNEARFVPGQTADGNGNDQEPQDQSGQDQADGQQGEDGAQQPEDDTQSAE